MPETKNDTIVAPLQIELDSLLAWRLQSEEYKRVYQVLKPESFLPSQKSTCQLYQFQNPQGEVFSFAVKPTAGDGDCFFHAVGVATFTRDVLVQKLFDNSTEAVRHVFAHEIRQFLYLGLSGSHPGRENEACQRLLTSEIKEKFLTLQKTEEELSVKVNKVRLALGKKETHGKRPPELLALLREKKSTLIIEFEQAHQAVLQADSAIYQYCCQEDIFKNYVQFYLKEARGYIPFSRDFDKKIPITTIDVINQLFGLKIQAYLPLNRSSTQLQLANQLQTGEVISIFHNGINHFGGLEKQKPLLELEMQVAKLDRSAKENSQLDLKHHAERRITENADQEAVLSAKLNLQEIQNNSPVFVHFNQNNVIEQKKQLQNSAAELEPMGLIETIKENNEKAFFEVLKLTINSRKRVVDEIDVNGEGALYWAAACGHLHFIEPLIRAGANVNKPNSLGRTPVYAAAHSGHAEIITALKAGGADVNTPDDSDTTPVCAAAYGGHAKAITALKAAGANVNATEANGLTPLYIAVQMGDITVINALLEAGANANTRTPQGIPLELAKRDTTQKGQDIVRLLETHLQQYPNGIKTLVTNSEATPLNQESHPEDFVKEGSRYGNPTVEAEAGRDINTFAEGISAQGQVVIGGGNMSNATEAGYKSSSGNSRKIVEVDNIAVLKRLKLFFMNNEYKRSESQDCELYNRGLAVHQAELVYDIETHVHKLFINDNPLEPQNAIKMLSKMILSLQPLNTQNTNSLTVEAKAGRDVNTFVGGIRTQGQVIIGGGNMSNTAEAGGSSSTTPRMDNIAALKQLKSFFMSNKYKGPESQDCELYNRALAEHTGELVYDLEEHLHKLWVNDEPLEQQNAIKMLSKMVLSLQPLNTQNITPNVSRVAANSGSTRIQAHAGRDVVTITGGVTSGGELRIGGGDMYHNFTAYNQFREQTAGQYNIMGSENIRLDNENMQNNKTNTWR